MPHANFNSWVSGLQLTACQKPPTQWHIALSIMLIPPYPQGHHTKFQLFTKLQALEYTVADPLPPLLVHYSWWTMSSGLIVKWNWSRNLWCVRSGSAILGEQVNSCYCSFPSTWRLRWGEALRSRLHFAAKFSLCSSLQLWDLCKFV